jgi:hypothetical protein
VTEGDEYQIQIAKLNTFTVASMMQDSTTAALLINANSLPDGKYYWRVRGINEYGRAGDWGPSFAFTVDTTPPAVPVLSSPANGFSGRGAPKHVWTKPSSTTLFEFQYDETGGDFSTPSFESGEITVYSYTPLIDPSHLGSFDWRVRGRDAAGNWSEWSAVRTVTILMGLPSKPTLTLPAINTVTNDTTPDFEWTDVPPWGDHYTVQISNLSNFSVLLVNEELGAGITTFTAPIPLADGKYYWRVIPENANGEAGAISSVFAFTVDTTPPASPLQLLPADGSNQADLTPLFTWKSSATTKMYELQWDDDSGFSSLLGSVQKNALLYQIPAADTFSYAQTIYWQIRARDAAGNWSPWSSTRTFYLALATTPKNGSFTTDTTPLLRWVKGTGVTNYSLEIDDDPGFGSPEIDLDGITLLYHQVITPLPYAQYYWRLSVDGGATWMSTMQFTLTQPPLAKPLQTSPAANFLTNDNTVDFAWTAVVDAGSYDLQIAKSSTFTATSMVANETGILDPSFSSSALLDGKYYWRVRAVNTLNYPGVWSLVRAFTVDTTPPAVPSLLKPVNGALNQRSAPLHIWTKPGGTVLFEIAYATDLAFTNVIYGPVQTPLYSFRPVLTETDLGVFYWRVRGRDAAGNWSAWSAPFSVEIIEAIPARVVLTSPLKSGTASDLTPDFEWQPARFGETYRIQISKNDKFSVSSIQQDFTGAAGVTSYTATELAPGYYYWRVQAINGRGEPGAWSAVWRVRILAP